MLRVGSSDKPDCALLIVSGIYPTICFATGSHDEIFGPNGTGEETILDSLMHEIGNLSSETDDHVITLPIDRDANSFDDNIDDSESISKFILNADHVEQRESWHAFSCQWKNCWPYWISTEVVKQMVCQSRTRI